MKNFDESVKINHNPNWPFIPDHLYRILFIGWSEFRIKLSIKFTPWVERQKYESKLKYQVKSFLHANRNPSRKRHFVNMPLTSIFWSLLNHL